ncbi:metalloendopeptidase [Trichonephila inaurata madagascariensis]|uniref:Metalloendopeptidase n=1 Tax=Trichonephila inaurata madagascariensis TaxID=2747483 RepID=A0A8X6YE69_9ARAC|nr:metalloendopeptidase [Trichonephila inaurata madagascariensis]
MGKNTLWKVTAAYCLILITIHVQAEDNLEDFDEKLILTQMSRSKTEKGHILFEVECPNKANLHCQNDGYRSPYQGNSKPCTCICPPNTKGKKCETITGDYYGSITCGGDVLTEGIIQSPGYPGRNPNESCTWQIKAPIRKRVQVTFEDFSFRPRMNKPSNNYNGLCVYEHVEIRTSNMEEGDFYCDEDIPKGTQMESSSNTFLIIIRADTKGEGRGFKASVKFI